MNHNKTNIITCTLAIAIVAASLTVGLAVTKDLGGAVLSAAFCVVLLVMAACQEETL